MIVKDAKTAKYMYKLQHNTYDICSPLWVVPQIQNILVTAGDISALMLHQHWEHMADTNWKWQYLTTQRLVGSDRQHITIYVLYIHKNIKLYESFTITETVNITSGYATMVHSQGCNPHRCTTTFANLEITSLWRHWWRHNSETVRDREKRRAPRVMKSSELSNGENRIALRQLLQNLKLRHWWCHNLGSR